MNKYITLGLRTLAIAGSVASIVAAYPAASQNFGIVPGAFILTASAVIIYAGWSYVSTSENTDRKLMSGSLAAIFSAAMIYGIHTSAELTVSASSEKSAEASDNLYASQEQARISTLASVTAELRATSKTKFPAEYATLQSQVDKLSSPTNRTATASQIVQGTATASSLYKWALAASFEIVTVSLLFLAGLFTATRTATANELTATEAQLTDTTNELTATEAQPIETTADPLDLLTRREITQTAEGHVTASSVSDKTGCTAWQAKDAIRKATAQGVLTRTGKGNAVRYTYTKQPLRIVK